MPDTGARCLPIASIRPSRLNPRRTFDEGALAELASSMKAMGLIQPVIVWERGSTSRVFIDGGEAPQSSPPTYHLIAGERRLRAAISLGWTQIPAVIRPEPTEDEARAMALLENLQREGLNAIEEAEGLSALYHAGMPQKEIAERIGRTQGFVSNRLRLLRLPEEVRNLIQSGAIAARMGEALLAWEDKPETLLDLARQASKPVNRLKVADVEAIARKEGRVRSHERGKKGGEVKATIEPFLFADPPKWSHPQPEYALCRECRLFYAVADLEAGLCDHCRGVTVDGEPLDIPRPTHAEWIARRAREVADIASRAHERRAEAEDLMAAMHGPLTSVAVWHDCRRLALITHHILGAIPNHVLLPLLGSRGLDHLGEHLNGFGDLPPEAGWEALAALSPTVLLQLAADALLARDLEAFTELGTEPRRARWYAGLEVEA